jgi:protein-tyrosine phosphatase
MIDFHSHVLPRIDDGSKSSDMSVDMLKRSYDYGIDVMVATPHFYIKHDTIDKFLKHREASYNALQTKLEKIGNGGHVGVPELRLGAEVYYFGNISAFPELDKLCIEGTRYLLLEMPFSEWTSSMLLEVERLAYDCNITPIIAHLDRYLDYKKNVDSIDTIVKTGALIQMNGEYVNGLFTRTKALKLIKSGVISLLGSDCHNLDKRAPNLDKTFDIIRKKCGQDTLDRIDRCGRSVLNIADK